MAKKETKTALIAAAADGVAEIFSRRSHTVGTRLTREEASQFAAIADARQLKVGDVLRELIVTAIAQEASERRPDPVLSEIVGIRLLLVNLLKPREEAQGPLSANEFKAILEGVRKVKRQVANDIKRDCAEGASR